MSRRSDKQLLLDMMEATERVNRPEVGVLLAKRTHLLLQQLAVLLIFLCAVDRSGAQDRTNGTIYGGIEVDQNPTYPGGDSAMYQALNGCDTSTTANDCLKSVQYVIRFVIEPDGSTSNIDVQIPSCHILEISSRCAVQRMAKWKPGFRNGQPVRTQIAIPMRLDLAEDP